MDWLKKLGRKKQDNQPDFQPVQRSTQPVDRPDNPEMEKLLNTFMRTCWPSDYGDHTLGVDTHALKELKGLYLDKAKAAILESLEKSPDINPMIAATAIELTEAIPIMVRWIQHIRSQEHKSDLYVAYGRLAHSLYNFTNEEIYLADLAEAVRASGFGELSDSALIHSLWNVPLTIDILAAVWEKLKKRKEIDESSSCSEACEDFLREKLDDPIGQAFLSKRSEIEQKEIRSMVAMTRNQRIERNRSFERFVVDRYDKSDLNKLGEYIKVGGSPLPGLTLRCILEGHSKKVNSTSWSPDGNYLASAGSDNIVVIWDVEKGDCISIIDGGEIDRSGLSSGYDSDYRISHVGWSTDGKYLAVGSDEKNVGIWNIKQEAFLVPPKREGIAVRKLAWAPSHNSLLYSYGDNTVWIMDIPSGKVRQIFEAYSGRIDALAWSSEASFIAAGYWDRKKYGKANGGAEDDRPEILLWDVKKERVVSRITSHDSYINHIAWMPDQPILAAASADHTISIWNMLEGRQLTSLETHTSPVTGVSFSAGGALLASTAEPDDMVRGTVRLWRTDTWKELIILKELESAEQALAFHPTLPLLATRCHGNPGNVSMSSTASFIRVWDLDFETLLRNPPFMDEFHRMDAKLGEQE